MRRALVCFLDYRGGLRSRLLKRGFRHVFCVIDDGRYWILVDAQDGVPVIEVLAGSDYDAAAFYRGIGAVVVETTCRAHPPVGPFAVANCVGMVKAALAISAPLAVTPWQLYRYLTR